MQLISKKKIILILSGLLITGTAFYAVQWKWHLLKFNALQNSSFSIISSDDTSEYPADKINESIGVREILSAHLFGQEDGIKKVINNNSGSVPKTQQPLELHGIIFILHHPEQTVALIAAVGGAAIPYKVGEELKPILAGWSISLISPESVNIKQNGTENEELLELPITLMVLNNPNPILTSPTGQSDNMPSPVNMSPQNLPAEPAEMEIPIEDPAQGLPPAQADEIATENVQPVDNTSVQDPALDNTTPTDDVPAQDSAENPPPPPAGLEQR